MEEGKILSRKTGDYLFLLDVYHGSLAMLAQLQRHRTIKYNMVFDQEGIHGYYVPMIILQSGNANLKSEWLNDIESLAEYTPQGTCVKIIERGTAENFILKVMERSCGRAQLETALRTKATAEQFFFSASGAAKDVMRPYFRCDNGSINLQPRCMTGFYRCTDECPFGAGGALERMV